MVKKLGGILMKSKAIILTMVGALLLGAIGLSYNHAINTGANDVEQRLQAYQSQITSLEEKVSKLEAELATTSKSMENVNGLSNSVYYNQDYQFGFYLPTKMFEHLTVIEEEGQEGNVSVSFIYNKDNSEGFKQRFFTVVIKPADIGKADASSDQPYLVQNGKAYYIVSPIDNSLNEEDSKIFKAFYLNPEDLAARKILTNQQ